MPCSSEKKQKKTRRILLPHRMPHEAKQGKLKSKPSTIPLPKKQKGTTKEKTVRLKRPTHHHKTTPSHTCTLHSSHNQPPLLLPSEPCPCGPPYQLPPLSPPHATTSHPNPNNLTPFTTRLIRVSTSGFVFACVCAREQLLHALFTS